MTAIASPERLEEMEQGSAPEEPVARTATQPKMFKYSDFIDLGEGAAECEHGRDGACDDLAHFHAWCRLPNPYQHQDIRAKGLAAKARKIRALRDPDSDESVTLDQALADIGDPAFVEQIIDELLAREWAEDYLETQRDVGEREEFEHVDQDREEFARLGKVEGDLPEDEQSVEYKRLDKHLNEYVEALRAELEAIQEPKRVELRAREPEAIAAIVRTKRVEEEADRAFVDIYNAWMWFVGTYRVDIHASLRRPHLPMWDDIGHRPRADAGTMFAESPEIIEALRSTFNGLQLALQAGSSGN